jgi:hypothetical protein
MVQLMLSSGSSDLIMGIAGAAGFITLLIAIIILFIYDRWISRERIMTQTIEASLT